MSSLQVEFGDPRMPEAFWRKVQISGECWEWTGPKHPRGYGAICIGDKKGLAHRVVFEAFNGYLPTVVDHICWNKMCIRPAHLRSSNWRANQEYRRSLPGSSSRFLGVSFDRAGFWRARANIGPLRPDGRRTKVNIGVFPSEEDAARAYDRAVAAFYETPNLNFPDEVSDLQRRHAEASATIQRLASYVLDLGCWVTSERADAMVAEAREILAGAARQRKMEDDDGLDRAPSLTPGAEQGVGDASV